MADTNTNNNDGATGAGVTVAGPTPGPYTVQEGYNVCVIWGAPPDHNAQEIARTERERQKPIGDQTHIVNAHLLASSWAFLAPCTPERLAALETVLYRGVKYSSVATIDARALLTDLRAAVNAAGGGRTT